MLVDFDTCDQKFCVGYKASIYGSLLMNRAYMCIPFSSCILEAYQYMNVSWLILKVWTTILKAVHMPTEAPGYYLRIVITLSQTTHTGNHRLAYADELLVLNTDPLSC